MKPLERQIAVAIAEVKTVIRYAKQVEATLRKIQQMAKAEQKAVDLRAKVGNNQVGMKAVEAALTPNQFTPLVKGVRQVAFQETTTSASVPSCS